MNALAPTSHRLTDLELIEAVTRNAALAEAESAAAGRFSEGSAVRTWHIERATKATGEVLRLINAPEYQVAWSRFADFATPAWPIRTGAAA